MSAKPLADFLDARLKSVGVDHFTAAELLTLGASHHDENSPAFGKNTLIPRGLVGNLVAVAILAENFRVRLGQPLRVLSAYRSPLYNRHLAGAADKSLHMQGKALDLAPVGVSVATVHRMAEKLWETGGIVGGLGFYGWGVHLDTGRRRRW